MAVDLQGVDRVFPQSTPYDFNEYKGPDNAWIHTQ